MKSCPTVSWAMCLSRRRWHQRPLLDSRSCAFGSPCTAWALARTPSRRSAVAVPQAARCALQLPVMAASSALRRAEATCNATGPALATLSSAFLTGRFSPSTPPPARNWIGTGLIRLPTCSAARWSIASTRARLWNAFGATPSKRKSHCFARISRAPSNVGTSKSSGSATRGTIHQWVPLRQEALTSCRCPRRPPGHLKMNAAAPTGEPRVLLWQPPRERQSRP
mmetsp:Transcript_20252/g.56224  ORF Transcript_20252/g.56224 Transcript_20252/m.56224 type:complete len:224 (+) Transcript_20252:787-1458(+)